jgi:ribosomal protein S18 acetylase RimI-like enzyme
MSLTIRAAEVDDRDRIVLFNQAMARETEGRELDRAELEKGVEKMLRDPSLGRYIVAERGGEIVGQLALTVEWSDWRNAEIWWIQSVYVSKRARREGVYTRLHVHVHDLARSRGVAGLRLYVDVDNLEAQACYRALGMRSSEYVLFEEMWK